MSSGSFSSSRGTLADVQGHTTTAPDVVSPFSDTDPRPLSFREAQAVLERARKRRAAVPQPRAYWEEPGLHGYKREVSLRRPVMQSAVKKRTERSYSTGKLPTPPSKHFPVAPVLVGAAVVGGVALAAWLWTKYGKQTKPTHVGDDDFCGFDLLGCEP